MNVQLSLNINDKLLYKIEEISEQMQIDKNDLIIKALKKYLFINTLKATQKRFKPIVKKQGFSNEEDIFNSVS